LSQDSPVSGFAIIFVLFMKKVILSIVAIYYFAVSCGVVINMHFCMDKLASSSLFVSQGKKCGRCGMEIHSSNGCCRDEFQIVKLDTDQQKIQAASFDFPNAEATASIPSFYISLPLQQTQGERHFHNHSPPLLSAQDTYLQNNVFRI